MKDPAFCKGKPTVNRHLSKETDIATVINRGHQLILELDRCHARMHDAVKCGLKPYPDAWRSARTAMASYSLAYSELTGIAHRLNVLIQAGELETSK